MQWQWAKANEKDLAKFVNEKAIQLLDKLPIKDRQKLLQDHSGRRTLVRIIYETLVTKGIRYDFEKYQPDVETQNIRTPIEILSIPGEGTCLDLALLFCSLCFGYDLLPLLVIVEGHAFTAVSLKHSRENWKDFSREREIFDTFELFQGKANLTELRKLIEDEAYIAVECTGFAHSQILGSTQQPEAKSRTSDGMLDFEQALKAGQAQLENPNRQFKFAIDIATAQYIWKIVPLEIPNLDLAEAKVKTEFNVNVKRANGGEVFGVKADEVTSSRNIEATVSVEESNQANIYGGVFGIL